MSTRIPGVIARSTAFVSLLTFCSIAATGLPARAANDFSECPQFFVDGKAPVFQAQRPARLKPLCYDAFAVLHSGATKTPVYVAERINKTDLLDAAGEKRTNRFFADARLPSADRANLEDYKGSGYARGHMAPAGNMANSRAMAQSFSLANMVPQQPRNNQGAWASIEKATRKYVMRAQGDVFIITGPVFDLPVTAIGPGAVLVPHYLFKLVYDPNAKRAWAHWIENAGDARAGRPIDYRELVRRTRIDFLPGVDLTGQDR